MNRVDGDSRTELERMFPRRSREEQQETRRLVDAAHTKVARRADAMRTCMLQAAVLFIAVDVLLVGISWKLTLADLAVGALVGYLWHSRQTEVNGSSALAAGGYILSFFVLGVPNAHQMILVLVAALVVALASGWMAKQRVAERLGV